MNVMPWATLHESMRMELSLSLGDSKTLKRLRESLSIQLR